MIEEPKVMRELHQIREKHYEETKHMTFKEKMKATEEEAKRVMKEYGINFQEVEKH